MSQTAQSSGHEWPEIPSYLTEPIVFRDKNLGLAMVAGYEGKQWVFKVNSGNWMTVRPVGPDDPMFIVDALNQSPREPLASQVPAQPRTMQLPYRQEYAHIDTRHAEDDWCKKAGCVPSCPLAPASPQVAETLEKQARELAELILSSFPGKPTADAMTIGIANFAHRAVRAALAESDTWRRLLWLNHARYIPGVHMPYGDDGEMQCCGIDFKRQSAAEIDEFLTRRAAQPTPAPKEQR